MDQKEYTPETIADTPLPSQVGEATLEESGAGNKTTQTYGPGTIQEQSVPTPRIATELLGTTLNTHSRKILAEFQFTSQGAIKIGNVDGTHGEIRISPDGIVALDKDGNTTIAIDGTTGDAVFAGTIQAGTLISGAVAVGDGNILIDGATKRMLFYDANGIPSIIIGTVS